MVAAFAAYAQGIGRPQAGPYPWLAEALASGRVRVAEAAGAAQGLAVLRACPEHHALDVEVVAVAPEAEGQRVGASLIPNAERMAAAAGLSWLTLFTVATFGHLRRFYEALRFKPSHIGPRPREGDGHARAFYSKPVRTAWECVFS